MGRCLLAGIYHGAKKPKSINQYLRAFREDIIILKSTRIQFGEGTVKASVKGLVCDAPATSFIKNITTHNAYYGCRKCETRGTWVFNVITHHSQPKTGGRVTYPEIDAVLRTDYSFRNRLQLLHHHKNGERSLIEDILSNVMMTLLITCMMFV